jgi:hypothetical protein
MVRCAHIRRKFDFSLICPSQALNKKVIEDGFTSICINNPLPNSLNNIATKSFLEKNNIRFLETPGASFQDMSFNFKVIALSPQIMLTEEPLIYYRQDNPNSSINNPKKIYCVCDEYEELTRFLNENKDLKELFNTQKLINQYGAYKWNMSRLNKDFHKEFLDKFSQDFKTFYENGDIKKEFYKSVNKHELNLLLNNTEKYYKKVICKKLF